MRIEGERIEAKFHREPEIHAKFTKSQMIRLEVGIMNF